MAKQEWGVKHLCLGCGAKFYDMGRSSIACPACEEPVAVSASNRTRRSRKGEVKEKSTRSSQKADGTAANEEEVLSDEVEDLIDDENEDNGIATLNDDEEEEDADVLAEADIDTTKIGEE